MTSQILSEIDAPCRNSTQDIFNIANLAVIFASVEHEQTEGLHHKG
jgi:hypothetical protein